MLKISPAMTRGNVSVEGTLVQVQSFRHSKDNKMTTKITRVGRSLLSYISTLQRDNEKLRAIDKELKGPLWLLL